MILLSFRRDFTSRVFFGPAPRWTSSPSTALTGRRCLFMLHGYENSAGAAEGNYENIERNLTDAGLFGPGRRYEQLVGVLWPGQTAAGFWLAEAAADRAANMLAAQLRMAARLSAGISIVSHSLGARVALRALELAAIEIGELVLLAPAVDDDYLARGEKYFEATVYARRIIVCHSRRDEVLNVWYRRFARFLNFNDVALGYHGPADPSKCWSSVSSFDGTAFVDSHGAWMSCKEMYAEWARLAPPVNGE